MRFAAGLLVVLAIGAALVGVIRVRAEPATVRFTVYVDRGVMYSGYQTHWGAAACSWNYPIGTQLELPDGMVVTCLDRGMLGSSGWIDAWMPDMATARAYQAHYGNWTTATVIRWGW
jgi:hypothetical protein